MPRPRRTRAEIQAMLDRGEWLSPGQVAILTGAARDTVDNWLNVGIRVPGGRHFVEYEKDHNGFRWVSPDEVRKLLEIRGTRRRVVRTQHDTPPAPPDRESDL